MHTARRRNDGTRSWDLSEYRATNTNWIAMIYPPVLHLGMTGSPASPQLDLRVTPNDTSALLTGSTSSRTQRYAWCFGLTGENQATVSVRLRGSVTFQTWRQWDPVNGGCSNSQPAVADQGCPVRRTLDRFANVRDSEANKSARILGSLCVLILPPGATDVLDQLCRLVPYGAVNQQSLHNDRVKLRVDVRKQRPPFNVHQRIEYLMTGTRRQRRRRTCSVAQRYLIEATLPRRVGRRSFKAIESLGRPNANCHTSPRTPQPDKFAATRQIKIRLNHPAMSEPETRTHISQRVGNEGIECVWHDGSNSNRVIVLSPDC
jgi:hypothetical protein